MYLFMCLKMPDWVQNSVDPDQTEIWETLVYTVYSDLYVLTLRFNTKIYINSTLMQGKD